MGYDRELFRTNWQAQAPGTNLADFIKNHQDFAEGVQTGGTNGDHATLPGFVEHAGGMTFNRGPEAMDLITDAGPGGRNLSSWSTDAPGGGSGGGTAQPRAGAPLFGTSNMFSQNTGITGGAAQNPLFPALPNSTNPNSPQLSVNTGASQQAINNALAQKVAY